MEKLIMTEAIVVVVLCVIGGALYLAYKRIKKK